MYWKCEQFVTMLYTQLQTVVVSSSGCVSLNLEPDTLQRLIDFDN